jgi:hypothetical protein
LLSLWRTLRTDPSTEMEKARSNDDAMSGRMIMDGGEGGERRTSRSTALYECPLAHFEGRSGLLHLGSTNKHVPCEMQ